MEFKMGKGEKKSIKKLEKDRSEWGRYGLE